MEDTEADIYDDIDDDDIAVAAAAATTSITSAEGSALAEYDKPSPDLYDDIYSFETPRELQQASEIKRLQGDVRELIKKLTDKESENHTLRKNMESLLLTARREIARKATEITELQRTVIRYETGKKLANNGGKVVTLGSPQTGCGVDARKAGYSQSNMVSLTEGRQAVNSSAISMLPLKPEVGVLSSCSGQAAVGNEPMMRATVPLHLEPERKQLVGSRADEGTATVFNVGGVKKGNKLEHVAKSDVRSTVSRSSLADTGRLHQLAAAPAKVATATATSTALGQGIDCDLSGARPGVSDCTTSRGGSLSHGGGLCKNANVKVIAGTRVTENVSSCPSTLDKASLSTVRHPISSSDSVINSRGSKHLNENRPSDILHVPVSAGSSVLADKTSGGTSYAISSPSESSYFDTKIESKQLKTLPEPMKLSERQLQCDSGKKSYSLTLPSSHAMDSLRSSYPTRESSVVRHGRSCASELVRSSEMRSHVNPKGEAFESASNNGHGRSSARSQLNENGNSRYDSERKGNLEPSDDLEENGSFSCDRAVSAGHGNHGFRSERATASLGKPEDKSETLGRGRHADRARGGWSNKQLQSRDCSKVGIRLPGNDGRKYEGSPAEDRPKLAEEKVTPSVCRTSTEDDRVKGHFSSRTDGSSAQRASKRDEACGRSELSGSSRLEASDVRRNATGNRNNVQDERPRPSSTDKRGSSSQELRLTSSDWRFSPSDMLHAESGEEGNTSSRQRLARDSRQSDSSRRCKASDVQRSAASDAWCTAPDVRHDDSEKRHNGSGQRCQAFESRNRFGDQHPAFNDQLLPSMVASREQRGSGGDSASTDRGSSQRDSRPCSERSREENQFGLGSSYRESRGLESRCDRDVTQEMNGRPRRDYLERDSRHLSNYHRHSRRSQDSEPRRSRPKHWSSDPAGSPVERDFEYRDDLEKRQPAAPVLVVNNSDRKVERRNRENERGHGPEASMKRYRAPSSPVTPDKYRRIDIEDGEVLSENERF